MRKSFKAVTWNVFYGTDPLVIHSILREQMRRGVSLFLLQEMNNDRAVQVFRDAGLRIVRVSPQYAIAWNGEVWGSTPGTTRRVLMAETVYFNTEGKPVHTDAVRVMLKHKASGRTLDVVSYHLPPSVQVPGAPERRLEASRESFKTLGRIARASTADGVLYGGDDNIDEFRGFGLGRWGFARRARTGLKLVQAPAATHGKVRRIDDFRTRFLKVGHGWVTGGGGDHRIHGRTFTFRK